MAHEKAIHDDLLDPLVILHEQNMTVMDDKNTARVLALEGASITSEQKQHPRMYLLGLIGKGSQAIVYKAWDDEEKKQVCIKMAKYPDKDSVKAFNRAFHQEAEFYGQLGAHSNIASMYFSGADTNRGIPSIVLERCYGNTLEKLIDYYRNKQRVLIKKQRIVPFKVRRKIMEDAAHAVQHCWSLGIAHCDLSPRNFIWYPSMDQPVKLVDFGLAVWFKKEKAFKGGSVGYYPPERIVGSEPHEKSDVFGLGCLFCSFYCTKKLPWRVFVGSVDTLKTFDENYRKKTDLELKDVNRPEKDLLKKMLAVYPDNRPDWDVILKEITTAKSGEQCQDMSKLALEMMEGSSFKPRPQQAIQSETEAMDTTNPLEADDEGTSMEEELAQEENEFTREHYKESLAAEQRTHQHQDRVFNDQMQGLGNASRIDSKKNETIKWVREEIDKTVESAKRSIESTSNKDEAKQVAKRMRNDVTQTGNSGKDEIARCSKDEIKIIEDEVSESESTVTALVDEAHEKINDLAVSVSQSLPH